MNETDALAKARKVKAEKATQRANKLDKSVQTALESSRVGRELKLKLRYAHEVASGARPGDRSLMIDVRDTYLREAARSEPAIYSS